MYSCYKLNVTSQGELKIHSPPKYEKIACHHVTETFGKDAILPRVADIEAWGYINTKDGLELFLVTVSDQTARPDGSIYHITHSCDPEWYVPKNSNEVIKNCLHNLVKFDEPIALIASPEVIQ